MRKTKWLLARLFGFDGTLTMLAFRARHPLIAWRLWQGSRR